MAAMEIAPQHVADDDNKLIGADRRNPESLTSSDHG